MSRQQEVLDRIYDHSTDQEIPITTSRDEYVLVQAINTYSNTDIAQYKRLLKSMKWADCVNGPNVEFVVFIDIDKEKSEAAKIIDATHEVLGAWRGIYFIIPQRHLHVIYARTIIFNFVVNMFKENFILSFSDDDDLHCDLATLYKYGKTVVDSEYIIPLRSRFKSNIISDVASHPAFWRFLFPWRTFYKYPMTLDITPVRMEDQRFVARMIKMNAFQSLTASRTSPIKYFYEEESERYNKSRLNKKNIAALMSVFDYRIYKTYEWMNREKRDTEAYEEEEKEEEEEDTYGTYTTNRRYGTHEPNLYSYSSRLTIPLYDKATKIKSWNVEGNKIIPIFDNVSKIDMSAEEVSKKLPHEVVLHPDEIIVCDILYRDNTYKYASFPMNVIRRSKFSKTFGQVELVEPYESWGITLHEYEKMNVMHGGSALNTVIGFGCVALVVLLIVRMKNKRRQHHHTI